MFKPSKTSKERHFVLGGDYDVAIQKGYLDGVLGHTWEVYKRGSRRPLYASSFTVGTLSKAKADALAGLGNYLHSEHM